MCPMRNWAVTCFALALLFAYATYGILGLTLTPQDSGVAASGEWGYAVVPGAVCVALVALGIVLWRKGE
jgi:succinate dehydrogenase/fumarate reductase cytochrome b subunit